MVTTTLTTLVGVPIDSAGRPNGLERMPPALREAGLVQQLNIRDFGDLPVAIDSPYRDPATGMIGFESVCKTSDTIRTHIKNLLALGERPFIIGGCCILLVGVFAALREQYGRVGLAFIDGHLDFYDGRSSPTGEAADMDLAILTGFGPAGLVDLAGAPPLVSPQDIVVLGYRDAEEAAKDGALDPLTAAPGITLVDAQAIRQSDPAVLGAETAKRFEAEPKRFWLHFDLDVLDQDILPAVDYRMPNGLHWQEVAELIHPLAHSPALVGADITIYNPNLDPGGQYAKQIVSWLGKILS
ncbi:MAG TPA: arginase family protein [Anaerolineae bacterium]|nr:arginase family protein [Anaerolineae bacterium]